MLTFTGVFFPVILTSPRFVFLAFCFTTFADLFQNIILSQKPPITTTMTSLPPVLLEQLLTELSTLASVYHKPPESFVGKGRYGTDEIQRAAIQEQRQNLAENPIAAAAAANGTGAASQSNIENLLDIDFDGAAPASAEHHTGTPGAGTPDRGASPATTGGLPGAPSSSMADMMGLFDAPSTGPSTQSPPLGMGNVMNSFAGMDLSGMGAPPPANQQLGSKPAEPKGGSDDLLGLF